MALDKDGELDIDKTVDGIVEDILPEPEPLEAEVVDEPVVEHKEEEEAAPPLEEKKEEPKPDLKEGDEGYVAPKVEPKAAPKSWSREMAPEFAKLPPAVQDYIAKREEDVTNGISQYRQAAEYGVAVDRVVSPYFAHLQSRGLDVPTALKLLLNADYTLSTGSPAQKANFFSQLLKDYGVEISQLGEPQEISAEARALTERLAKTEGKLSQYERSQQEQRRAEVTKTVDAFASDPKNVYFNELGADITKLINAGYTLEEAYQKAVWANPVTRAKELARTSKEAEAAAKKKAEEAAAKAKRLNKSNVKETPSDKKASTTLLGSMDDTLRSTFRSIQERST